MTTDKTHLNYSTMFNDRTNVNSITSIFIKTQKILNESRNLTQQENQTASHFANDEVAERTPTTI